MACFAHHNQGEGWGHAPPGKFILLRLLLVASQTAIFKYKTILDEAESFTLQA